MLFWPKKLDISGKKSISVNRGYHKYTGGYHFPIWNTHKKNSISELGVIFRGSPLFLALLGHSHVRGISTLNFGPISTKLGGTVRAIKKMTQKDNGPGPGRNYGETGVFTFGRKVVFGLKMGFTPKNHPKWYFPPWLFGQRHFFLWTTFSGRGQNMANHWLSLIFIGYHWLSLVIIDNHWLSENLKKCR